MGNSSTLLADPTGLPPEYGAREWFRWFYTRDIAATYTGYSDEDRQKRREALIRTADNMYELMQAVIKANPSWRELGDREAARIAFLRIRAAQARELANCYARNGSIGPHPESSHAYRQAVAEFDDNLVVGGSSPGMRMLIYACAPSGATSVPPLDCGSLLPLWPRQPAAEKRVWLKPWSRLFRSRLRK